MQCPYFGGSEDTTACLRHNVGGFVLFLLSLSLFSVLSGGERVLHRSSSEKAATSSTMVWGKRREEQEEGREKKYERNVKNKTEQSNIKTGRMGRGQRVRFLREKLLTESVYNREEKERKIGKKKEKLHIRQIK